MAIDYIIGGLQFLSAAVNILALGAFWISPGLRSTANRFVINLLVANIIGCLALTPALWLNGGLETRFYMDSDKDITTVVRNTGSHQQHQRDVQSNHLQQQAALIRQNTDERFEEIDGSSTDGIGTTKSSHEQQNHKPHQSKSNNHRTYHHAHHTFNTRHSSLPIHLDEQRTGKDVIESIETVVIERESNGHIRQLNEKKVIDARGDEEDELEIIEEIDGDESKSVTTKKQPKVSKLIEENPQTLFIENSLSSDCTRFWGFDLAAALGGLSVVLVVGDTWCAVTDPLRYHSRISYLKSWILIASVWLISILFSIGSALRDNCSMIQMATTSSFVHSTTNADHLNESTITTMTTITTTTASATFIGDSFLLTDIYNLIFSCAYFTLIILVPIIVVCIMYWNIFSEARQSGMRMRRNGSSPLLQSALNLHNPALNCTGGSLNEHHSRYPSFVDMSAPDAITMKIDAKYTDDGRQSDFGKNCVAKMQAPVATHHYRRYLDIPECEQQQQQPQKRERSQSDKNGLKPKLAQFRRNFSSRQLMSLEQPEACHQPPTVLLKNQNSSRMITEEMRQVHSSPNLEKFANMDLLHKIPYCGNNCSNNSINHTHHSSSNSPKALSYMISIRHRLSNASSIFKYREESRAARISIVVVAMFLLSYLPYGLLILLQGRITFIPNASLLSILFLLIGNMSTPFIFAYRNRRVRRGVCRLFGVDAKPNSYLQKQRMQLRNGQINSGSNKNVRIHHNLSASNFSLNLLPYKFASNAMLPIQHEQSHGNIVANNGSVLVPIDDEEIETNEPFLRESVAIETAAQATNGSTKNDINNNGHQNESSTVAPKEKISLLKRLCSVSKKSSENEHNDCSPNKNDTNDTKDTNQSDSV